MCFSRHRFLHPARDSGESSNPGSDAQDFGLCYQNLKMKLQSQHMCILGEIIYGYVL